MHDIHLLKATWLDCLTQDNRSLSTCYNFAVLEGAIYISIYPSSCITHVCMQFLPIPPCHLQTLSLSLYTLHPKWLAMTFFILNTGRVVFLGGFSWVTSLILQTYKSSCLTHRHASIYFFEIHSLQWAHTCTHVPFFLIWFLLSYLQIDPSTHTGTEQTLHVDDVQVTILYCFHFNLNIYFINALHAITPFTSFS